MTPLTQDALQYGALGLLWLTLGGFGFLVWKVGIPTGQRISAAFDGNVRALNNLADKLSQHELDSVKRHAEALQQIEQRAKENRHDTRNLVQTVTAEIKAEVREAAGIAAAIDAARRKGSAT
jgi:hypothetical protein